MSIYKYHIYHIIGEKDYIDYESLTHEYDNIDTALHLYCRQNGFESSAEAKSANSDDRLMISVEIDYFESKKDADKFIDDFLKWLRLKLSSRIQAEFYPKVDSI